MRSSSIHWLTGVARILAYLAHQIARSIRASWVELSMVEWKMELGLKCVVEPGAWSGRELMPLKVLTYVGLSPNASAPAIHLLIRNTTRLETIQNEGNF